MPKCCIGFGQGSYFYKYIITCILFNYLKDLALKYTPVLSNVQIVQSLYKYIGFFIFGIILLQKYRKTIKKKINFKKTKKIRSTDYKLIHNKNIFHYSFLDFITLFFISFFYVMHQEGIKLINYFGFYNLEFWTFDIVFILIFMYFYFPSNTYKHQTYSMIFIILFDSILLIIASVLNSYHIENENVETYQNIYEYKGYFECFFVIIVFIDITFLISFSRIKGKILMDQKFISPYTIILTTGILGLISNSIFSKILNSKINGNKCYFGKSNEKYNIYCYGDTAYYFTTIKAIKGIKLFKEIILSFFYIIFYFVSFTCEIFIIKYLNPNYLLMSDNVYFEILKIVNYAEEINKKLLLPKFIILQISELLEFIGCAIYLEIIELKFCGLNKDIKRKIMERAENDILYSLIESSEEEKEIDENNDSSSSTDN